MRADGGVYPRLGRYFKTAGEFAEAACMTRPTLTEVLQDNREFTRSEKAAICGRLLAKVLANDPRVHDLTTKELLNPDSFDELFRDKGA